VLEATAPYKARKTTENAEFIHDLALLRRQPSIADVRLLALDDHLFGDRTDQMPHTMKAFLAAGASPGHVWIVNPSAVVTTSAQAAGGHGIQGRLRDATFQGIRFDALYLDFERTWDSDGPDVRSIIERHEDLLADTVVLHITSSRRKAGGAGCQPIRQTVQGWVETYGYGRCLVIREYASAAMLKIALLLVRV
jgi:hypothetical protein